MSSWTRIVVGAALLFACRRGVPTAEIAAPAPAEGVMAKVEFREDPEAEGLVMRLYEAEPAAGGAEGVPVAAASPLSEREAAALLARLPPLEGEDADRAAFALREGPVPPPRTGATVNVPFPPAAGEAAPVVESGPLAVQRKAPVGPVPMAPHLSVTFSQPMVAVQSQAEAARQVPVRLTPTPAGAWRWLGSRTLQFAPDPRFPMATRYTVEIPAGTRSATGGTLATAETWTFETPPPKLEAYWPYEDGGWRRGVSGNPQPTDPLLFLGFDQAVDPAAVVERLRVTGGGDSVPVRLASSEEIAAKPEYARRLEGAQPGRALVVRPVRDLQRATTYRVVVPVGTPSAEGPLTTTAEQSFSFRTYGPLGVAGLACWGQRPCPPTTPWQLSFTNPLDADAFDPASITVTPAVPGLEIAAEGAEVRIFGAFTARTTYTVSVAAGVRDIFGQSLAAPTSRTIDVGPAEQTLVGPPTPFVVVDPAASPAVSFFTVNHRSLRLTVHRVRPEDWVAWTEWLQRWRWEEARPAPFPGVRVAEKVVEVVGGADTMAETAIDLRPYLQGGAGHFLVKVEPTQQPKERWRRQEWMGWVQVSQLGLTAFVDHAQLTGWVSALKDGAAVPGARLALLGADAPVATTGADGLATVALQGQPAVALVARAGDDAAILPSDAYGWGGGGWMRVDQLEQLRWYVFDDKNLYKPGETVHVRGWLRRPPAAGTADPRAVDGAVTTVRWQAWSSQGNPLGEGTARVTGLGGFTFDLPLPKTPNLGTARIDLQAEGNPSWATSLGFEIQEFRTPEFEVIATGGDGVYALGEDARVDVEAKYYAGGGLPTAPVGWTVSATPATFTPPGRSDWSFGPWAPWWRWWDEPAAPSEAQTLQGVTDAAGTHRLGIHFEALNPARPMTVTAEATVQDVNRQAWSASRSFLVHPAAWYVGLRTARPYVEAGKPVEVQTLVVDREGREVADAAVTLTFRKLVWKRTGRGWEEAPEVVATETVPAGSATGTVRFTPPAGGSYAVVATLRDAQGRRNETELRVWVSGGDLAPDRGVEQERVTLVPEKETWTPGETASFLVQAPFFPAEGVMTVRAGGLLEARRFTLDGPTTTLSLPITEAHLPDVTVAVDLVGARVRSGDDGRPRADLARRVAFAAGSLTFKVSTLPRSLAVKVVPVQARLDPGARTAIDLAVTDAAGAPVAGAELAVVAVDEAVLALTGYRLPDPLAAFYAARGDGVGVHHLRQWVVLANPLAAVGGEPGGLGGVGSGYGGGGGRAEGAVQLRSAVMEDAGDMAAAAPSAAAPMEMKKASRSRETADAEASLAPSGPQIQVRSDFSAVALWAPSVVTDARGAARVELQLPDSLTRYRVMVVAVAGARQFGSGEADVTARLPLMVRPSAPRFLNFGDRFELPVVVQNQTDAPMTVDVAVRAANASFLGAVADPMPDPATARGGLVGKRVTVPANDRVEVRFPTAAAMAGTARFQFAAASGSYADAATVSLPVWTPATTEAFATYGTFDQGAAVQPVAPPAEVWPQFGGLEVTLSSTQLQALSDAFVYLVRYPYDCNEQIASRLLAIAALRDVLGAFAAEGLPDDAELAAFVTADLERLARRQNPDGGFAFWRRGDESWPYLSVHAAHAMIRAREKGWAVDAGTLQRSLRYLDSIERRIPGWYSKEAKWALRAYALNVLSLSGKNDVAKAQALLAEAGVDALPAEAKGWILPVLVAGKSTREVDALRRWMENHLTESAAGAHFTTSYSDGAHVLLHSDRRVDGVWLEALLRTDARNDVVPKLVNGLLAHRKAGKWANTNESAFVLLALDRYFRVYEGVTPDFVARVWLGDGYAGEHAFRGRTTERAQIDVPMATVQKLGARDLVVGKEGPGRLYYRVGMRYAPTDLDPEPADYGFTVLRRYEAVDDPADVKERPDGSWEVRAGARVRVKLTMVAPMRRYHVALVDPLPAGFEVLNPDLKGTGALPSDPTTPSGPYWWWTRTWYEHENLRDERVEAFASLLWDGVHEYSYVARATTPGDFVVPPAKAEEMYSPETFGRSGGDRVAVK